MRDLLVYGRNGNCFCPEEALGLCQWPEQLRAIIPGYMHHSPARLQHPASRAPLDRGRHEHASLCQA